MPLGWILVDEDNIDNLELVRFLLEKAGHQVYCADDGLQGFRAWIWPASFIPTSSCSI